MPQSIWTGSISFGLVNIPVKLFSAVSRKTVHFNQLDVRTNARIKQKRVSSDDGVEVPYEQIVKGYELDSGNYVVITDEELAALDPKAMRTIDIDEFVDLADIDPIFFDSAYYLAPNDADKPYALLARAMEESGKIGVAHFVMRSKRYLAAVRPKDGRLLLSTMVYADEVRPPEEIPGLAELDEVELSDKELEMARQLVDSLGAPFEPDKFHDTYREAVLELIDRKASGDETVATPLSDDEPDKVIDLMAALEASVAAAKEARGRHPTGSTARKADGRRQEGRGPSKPTAEDGGQEGRVKAPPRWLRPRRRRPRTAAAKKAYRGIGHAHPQVGLGSGPTDVAGPSVVDIDGHQLKLSNLDKVLYPEVGFTKGQVIDYYARVAPAMLTHVSDRCVTFRRFPNGVDAASFFEKRCPSHRPGWVEVALGPGDRTGPVEYCLLDDRAALVWAANLAALELHTPMARADDIEAPADGGVRPRPGRTGGHDRVRGGGAGDPGRAGAPRPGAVGQDVGLEGAAALPAAQQRPTPTTTPASSPWPWPSSWRSTTPSWWCRT